MDDKLKEAIATVRSGDKQTAQRQLTALLEENPTEAQGWYLLSLLVDSPQKQAAYLSKTLSLNPDHAKAQEQLTTLQKDSQIAPTTTIREQGEKPLDVVAQSDSDTLPNWLQDSEEQVQAIPSEEDVMQTAVPNETLPDWLKQPVEHTKTAEANVANVIEEPAPVAQTIKPDKVATPTQKTKKQPKTKPAPKKSSAALNIILGILVLLAFIVMVLLAYLIFV